MAARPDERLHACAECGSTPTSVPIETVAEPNVTRELQWDRVARWTDDLVAGRLDDISRCFIANGVSAPVVAWSPDLPALPAAPLKVLMSYWWTLAEAGGVPRHDKVDPIDLAPALGFINILEQMPDSDDLRYRLFGSTVAEVSGFDLTGRMLSHHPASAYVTEFALSTTKACIRRREPLFTIREPAGADRTFRWPRLALPLADGDGNVVRAIVATVPLDANGLIVT